VRFLFVKNGDYRLTGLFASYGDVLDNRRSMPTLREPF
jgi:hypothetical protein